MIRDRKTGILFYEDEWRRWLKENNGPSFNQVTPEILELLDADPVFEGPQPVLTRYQVSNMIGTIQKEDGKWYTNWIAVDLDDDAKLALDERVAETVRTDRNNKLLETDWVVIKALETNSPLSTEWISYRQALRDITQQPGFPWDIVWPSKP